MQKRNIRIATRTSPLALAQTREVIQMLEKVGIPISQITIVDYQTTGDKNLSDPLYKMQGQGAFVRQLEIALLENVADIAIHSLKDMPTQQVEGLTIGCVPKMEWPRNDALVINPALGAKSMAEISNNSVLGTSSLRRISCLKYKFPEKQFQFENIRGNIDTRLRKVGFVKALGFKQSSENEQTHYDAIILAAAGMYRLGFQDFVSELLDEKVYLHAPGQAALGIQCRSNDEEILQILQKLNDSESRSRVESERTLMHLLEGGCTLPIGVTTFQENQQ